MVGNTGLPIRVIRKRADLVHKEDVFSLKHVTVKAPAEASSGGVRGHLQRFGWDFRGGCWLESP